MIDPTESQTQYTIQNKHPPVIEHEQKKSRVKKQSEPLDGQGIFTTVDSEKKAKDSNQSQNSGKLLGEDNYQEE